jgi:hypothetical protein
MEAMVAYIHRGEHDRTQVNYPRCDGRLQAQAFVCRTVETLVGPVQLERPYFYYRSCREGLYPLDAGSGAYSTDVCHPIHRKVAT